MEDAREAAKLGAAYVGVIFAGGPRQIREDQAAQVLGGLPGTVRRVGVFADQDVETISSSAHRLGLHVVQLHGNHDSADIERIRKRFRGEIWSVVRVEGSRIPLTTGELFEAANGVLLDAKVAGQLGGTGRTLPWPELVARLDPLRNGSKAKLVLAGGLRAENVADAIRVLRPDVVDVSSGVETAPGIKDHARMRAFRDAVHAST